MKIFLEFQKLEGMKKFMNKEIIYKKIEFFEYSKMDNWSIRYLKENNFNYDEKYKLFKISDFLKRNKDIILIEDEKKYKRVTIKLYNKGVKERDEEIGKNIGTKKQYLVKKGQFIMSKIDARNGAFGIVPEELEGAITTADFLSYDIDITKINPIFLSLLTSTTKFLNFCQNSSSGTTGRQRINESTFLDIKIPLPLLEEQNKIVEKFRDKIKKAEEQENEAEDLEKGIEEYLFDELGLEKIEEKKSIKGLTFVEFKELERWDTSFDYKLISKFNVKKIKECCLEISTGTTPPTDKKEYFDGDINFYTPSDLTNIIYLNKSQRKISELALKHKKARIFSKGTLLFVGIGSTIGKVAIINNEIASSNQQITGLNLNNEIVNVEYAYYYFNYFKNITTKEKTQATIPIVNQEKILNISIVCPPMEVQNEIVNIINKKNESIGYLKVQVKKNRKTAIDEFEKEIFQDEN